MRSRRQNRFYTKDATISDLPVSVETKTRKPRAVALVALLLILIIGGVFLYMQFAGSSQKKSIVSIPTSTPSPATETPTPVATVSGTITPSISPTVSPTGKQSASVDKTTGLDRAAITVDIQNGSGVAGAASKVSNTLSTLGYTIGTTGNAKTFDYTNVTIQVKATKAQYLPLLKKDLSAAYTVSQATKDLPASSSSDALVVVGK